LKAIWEAVALLIVHNILMEFGDNPHDIRGFNGEEDADPNPNEAQEDDLVHNSRGRMQMTETELYRAGLWHRKQLLDLFREI